MVFRLRHPVALLLAAGLVLSPTSAISLETAARTASRDLAAVEGPFGDNLAEFLDLTRQLLSRKQVREFLRDAFKKELKDGYLAAVDGEGAEAPRTKDITETQFLLLLNENKDLIPELKNYLAEIPKWAAETSDPFKAHRQKWKKKFRDLFDTRGTRSSFKKLANPLQALELNVAADRPGYRNPKLYVNHPWKMGGRSQPVSNLKQVWIDVIRSARKEIILNVFDFDLIEVADALIERHVQKIKVQVGIDKGVIEHRPEVRAVYDKLLAAGVFVHAVHSVGLNHQKLLAVDWNDPNYAKVLLSSGNLTQSCSGPEGDLIALPAPRPAESIPNANHAIVMESQLLALLIHHELSKTIAPGLQFRGTDYPLGGSYKIYGPEANGSGQERPFILVAFSPNGAFNNVNKHFISKVVRSTSGPIGMAQFAFSSNTIEEALLERAKKTRGPLDFISVGDTPFAMQDWSAFLRMSGMALQREPTKKYYEVESSPWKKAMSQADFSTFRRRIRIAPKIYGNKKIRVNGQSVDVSSKIHHKLLVSGVRGARVGVTGSFNFSTGAESNQEYIIATSDQAISEGLYGIIESLWAQTQVSVYEEAQRRNRVGGVEDEIDPTQVETQSAAN